MTVARQSGRFVARVVIAPRGGAGKRAAVLAPWEAAIAEALRAAPATLRARRRTPGGNARGTRDNTPYTATRPCTVIAERSRQLPIRCD